MTMSTSAITVIEMLRDQGHRVTPVRLALLDILMFLGKPISAVDIIKRLNKRGRNPHKTTIYRELEFLLEQSFIRELVFDDGRSRYEMIHAGHFHHLICLCCKRIEKIELKNDLAESEKKIKRRLDFKVLRHSLEFYGLCRSCQHKSGIDKIKYS